MITRRKQPNIDAMKGLMKRFIDLDVHNLSIEEIQTPFAKLIEYYMFVSHNVAVGTKLHRMRPNEGDKYYETLDQLWCPGSEKVQRLGRANDIHQSVLYTSLGASACIKELFPQPPVGSFVTCVEFEVVKSFGAVQIGVTKHHKNIQTLKNFIEMESRGSQASYGVDEKLIALDKKLKDFICTEFIRFVPEGREYMYKKSAAIAKQFFLTEYFTGIFYPSVKSNNTEINLAIHPEKAMDFLRPVRVDVLEILPKNGNLDRARHIQTSFGEINFTKKLTYSNPIPIEGWLTYDNRL